MIFYKIIVDTCCILERFYRIIMQIITGVKEKKLMLVQLKSKEFYTPFFILIGLLQHYTKIIKTIKLFKKYNYERTIRLSKIIGLLLSVLRPPNCLFN